jgi:hypothetical protein
MSKSAVVYELLNQPSFKCIGRSSKRARRRAIAQMTAIRSRSAIARMGYCLPANANNPDSALST